jgi:hypothetical protein
METIGASHSTAACEALLQRHHVLERRGIFADAPAAGAGQVAGVQRFELQDHRKFGRLAELVLDDVAGDFLRQREWETHNLLTGTEAMELEISGNATGALVGGGSAFMMPGRKKSNGETLWLALDAAAAGHQSANAASRPSHRKFQLNLTCRV